MSVMMTIKEAASTFRLSEYAVRQGIRQGKLPAFQLNGNRGKYVIDSESFADALKDLCAMNLRRTSDAHFAELAGATDFGTKIRRIHG